jgi:pimeloyl-ACP methyl ester carboxylesterase
MSRDQLGFPQLSIAGHDRGGRVAHRLTLDYPHRVRRLMVLDIAPTLFAFDHMGHKSVRLPFPFSALALPFRDFRISCRSWCRQSLVHIPFGELLDPIVTITAPALDQVTIRTQLPFYRLTVIVILSHFGLIPHYRNI